MILARGDVEASPSLLDVLYGYAWFVTFASSFLIYLALSRGSRMRPVASTNAGPRSGRIG